MEQDIIDLGEILKDPKLSEAVGNKLIHYRNQYYHNSNRRNPLFSLVESGNYNAGYFIDEFIKITTKSCKLPKAQRETIVEIVGEAMHDLWLRNQQENGNKEKSGSESPNAK